MVLQSNFSKYLVMLVIFSVAIFANPSFGQENIKQSSGDVFSAKLQAVDTLLKIKVLMLDSRTQLRTSLSEVIVLPTVNKKTGLALSRGEANRTINGIEKNMDTLVDLYREYQASGLSLETKALADKFSESDSRFLMYGLKPAVSALRNDNYADAKKYAVASNELFAVAANDLDALINAQIGAVQSQYLNDVNSAALPQSTLHTPDTIAVKPQEPAVQIQVQPEDHSRAYAIVILFLGFVVGLAIWMVRSRLASLPRTVDLVQQIANGRYDNPIEVQRKDTFSQLLLALKALQTRLHTEREEYRHIDNDNLLYKRALDALSVGVMIADADRTIVYANRGTKDILRKMESTLRQRVPQLDVNKIVGMSMDSFHTNAGHQANMLNGLTSAHTGEFVLGGVFNRIIASPIIDGNGVHVGSMAEWFDDTEAKTSEKEIVEMIRSISNGDFKKRITTAGKTGFYKEAGKGFNSIVDIFDAWLKEIVTVFASIEMGDLTKKIDDDGSDAGAFSSLARHSNAAVDNLHRLIEQIHYAADAISIASREMAEGNTDLSQRTEQQASSLEETASSMEELASTVKTNAENAKQANQMAAAASSVAAKGGAVVREVVKTMESINASSSKIVDIISVIDGIAFQTNILALNAAVEAARAGEQGRGFAVVAGEVRTLAQKSASAAKEIKQLISDSVGKVEVGSKQVKEAGDTMDEIVTSVKRVTDIMDEISAASVEQSAGIDQINQAITQMDEVTQQNAALVEESAASATSLEEQAQALIGAVGVFKLSATAAPARLASAPAKSSGGKKPKASVSSSSSLDNDWQEF